MTWQELFHRSEARAVKLAKAECRTVSAFFMNLTVEEYRRFEKAKIPYSGSTGENALPKNYNGDAPYFASFAYCVPKALRVLGWNHPSIKQRGVQWFIRKKHCKSRRPRNIVRHRKATQ